MIDELIEVAYDKAPSVVERFDESKGVELRAYVFNSLRWWMFKYMNKEARRHERFPEYAEVPDIGEEQTHETVQDDREVVYNKLEGVSEYERTIILLYNQGHTWREMAEICGVRRERLHLEYVKAIRKLRHGDETGA